MIEIERKFGCTASDFFAIFHKFFNTAHFRKGRSHGTDTPCANLLGMFSQTLAGLHASASHMYDNLKTLRSNFHPTFCQFHALVFGQHITFTGRTIDKYSLKTILYQQLAICFNRFIIHFSVFIKRGKRCVNKSDNLFHNYFF